MRAETVQSLGLSLGPAPPIDLAPALAFTRLSALDSAASTHVLHNTVGPRWMAQSDSWNGVQRHTRATSTLHDTHKVPVRLLLLVLLLFPRTVPPSPLTGSIALPEQGQLKQPAVRGKKNPQGKRHLDESST